MHWPHSRHAQWSFAAACRAVGTSGFRGTGTPVADLLVVDLRSVATQAERPLAQSSPRTVFRLQPSRRRHNCNGRRGVAGAVMPKPRGRAGRRPDRASGLATLAWKRTRCVPQQRPRQSPNPLLFVTQRHDRPDGVWPRSVAIRGTRESRSFPVLRVRRCGYPSAVSRDGLRPYVCLLRVSCNG